MANIQLQLRRGTTAEHATFTGATGELTFNTSTGRIHAHDGALAGGKPLALLSELSSLPATGSNGQILTVVGGSVVWAAPAKQVDTLVSYGENTSSAMTLGLATGRYLGCYLATAQTVTIPNNASVAFPIGTQFTVFQGGVGSVTIVLGSGVSVFAPDSLTLRKRYSACTLTKVSTDIWHVAGDMLIS